jgi:hypothetical protein
MFLLISPLIKMMKYSDFDEEIAQEQKKGNYFYGGATWKVIHTMCLNFDPTIAGAKEDMLTFLKFFRKYYPCPKCRIDFGKFIDTNPPQLFMSDGETLFLWSYIAHDFVNERKLREGVYGAKKSPSLEEIKGIYMNALNVNENHSNSFSGDCETCGNDIA